jgi:hypothetical protein
MFVEISIYVLCMSTVPAMHCIVEFVVFQITSHTCSLINVNYKVKRSRKGRERGRERGEERGEGRGREERGER